MTNQPHAGWWLYFWLLVVSNVASIFLDPPDPEDWMLLLLSGIGLLGLWGYLQERALGHRLFWVAFFGLGVLSIAYYLTQPFLLDPAWRGVVLGGAVVGLVVSAPLLVALWRYAFRSPGIWGSAHAV